MRDKNLLYAKQKLVNNGYTCVLYNGENIIASTKRGVAPLIELLETGDDFEGFVAADKVVGRATAFLYVLLKINSVYANVISKGAINVFEKYCVSYSYGELVDNIKNREGTGCCPMEEVTKGIEDAEEAFVAVKKRYIELKEGIENQLKKL